MGRFSHLIKYGVLMHGSKLLDTLAFFNETEISRLDDFLASPYYLPDKKRKDIYPLFQYILQYHADYEHPDLDKNKVYKHLYPNQKLIKGKVDKLMSGLLKAVYRFISINFWPEQELLFQSQINLVRFFRQHKANKYEVHYLEKLKKEQSKTEAHSKQHYFNNYLIAQEQIERYLVLDQRFDSFDYNQALRPLDIYYLLNKLEYACFLLSLNRFRKNLNIKDITYFLDHSKPLYAAQGLLNIPLITVYYQAYEMLKTIGERDVNYWKLKNLIQANEHLIPTESLKVLNGMVRAFMIDCYNQGASHLLEEIFLMHQSDLKKGYLNYKKGILPSTFKNLVTLGLRVKDYDWVLTFLNAYKNKIAGTNYPEDVFHYNLSSYYFARKEYKDALRFQSGQYEDLFYKNAAKRLELKIYYETQSEILDAKMDAFKIYIYRLPKDAILDYKRSSNNNFINFLRQLRNPKTEFSSARAEKLIAKIKSCNFLTEKDWLLEKVKELNKSAQ